MAPGFVETDMLETVSERVTGRILQRIPLDRFATSQDIAGVVRFLASDDASYVTGQILSVLTSTPARPPASTEVL